MSADEIYHAVTDRMVQALEQGVVPWRTPWSLAGRPRSMSTGNPYRGVNTWLLALASREHGWRSPWFGTYGQIQERGGPGPQGREVHPGHLLEDAGEAGPRPGDRRGYDPGRPDAAEVPRVQR